MNTPRRCPFCAIASGNAPALFVPTLRVEVLAFVPLRPAVWGHLLVIPRVHAEKLWEVPDVDLWATVSETRRLASEAAQRFGAEGVNVVVNNGRAAHQTIPHVHLHVLPRKRGDELGAKPLSAEYGSARYYDDARRDMAVQWRRSAAAAL